VKISGLGPLGWKVETALRGSLPGTGVGQNRIYILEPLLGFIKFHRARPAATSNGRDDCCQNLGPPNFRLKRLKHKPSSCYIRSPSFYSGKMKNEGLPLRVVTLKGCLLSTKCREDNLFVLTKNALKLVLTSSKLLRLFWKSFMLSF
jgi:hypothetical protein